MKTAKILCFLLFVFCFLYLISCIKEEEKIRDFEFQDLEFPCSDTSDIESINTFGNPDTNVIEPHNATDLVVFNSLEKTEIISPATGTIQSIRISENPLSIPANQVLLTIVLYINSEWSVYLIFEPSTILEETKRAQIYAITSGLKQEVEAGQKIADLIVGELGYPHLHYIVKRNNTDVCAYSFSSETAQLIFESIAERSNSTICY